MYLALIVPLYYSMIGSLYTATLKEGKEPMKDKFLALAEQCGKGLLARQLFLSTAESCTGGGLSYWITAIAGSATWFDRGFVTYSNAAKQKFLGVKEATFAEHGAVSEAVAREMAEG